MTVPVRHLRKAIPMGVKLEACLVRLGFSLEEIRTPGAIAWDHSPPLGLRDQVEVNGKIVFSPDQHDPRHLYPMRTAEHREKSSGAGATCANGDTHKIHKAGRLSTAQQEFRARLLAKGEPDAVPAPTKPKRRWASRPMRRKG